MALKDDIKAAIDDSKDDWLLPLDTQILTDKVWAVLEDKLGAVQEKLMQDLGHARTARDQAVAREATLREIVAQQTAELDHLRGQVASQQ